MFLIKKIKNILGSDDALETQSKEIMEEERLIEINERIIEENRLTPPGLDKLVRGPRVKKQLRPKKSRKKLERRSSLRKTSQD